MYASTDLKSVVAIGAPGPPEAIRTGFRRGRRAWRRRGSWSTLRGMTSPLAGKVALVAGASRGAGRGIAVQLGATVYVTGRTSGSRLERGLEGVARGCRRAVHGTVSPF